MSFNIFARGLIAFCVVVAWLTSCFWLEAEAVVIDTPAAVEDKARVLDRKWDRVSIDAAFDLYAEAAERWRQTGNLAKASTCVRAMAHIHRLRAEHDSAAKILRNNFELIEDKGLIEESVQTAVLLSSILLDSGEFENAHALLAESGRLAEQSGDSNAMAAASFGWGEFHNARRDFGLAEEEYKRSISYYIDSSDILASAQTLLSYANLLMAVGDPLKGIQLTEDAGAKFAAAGDVRGVSLSLIAKGNMQSVMGEKQDALESYQLASDNFPLDLDRVEKARLLNGVGYVYEEYGEWTLSYDNRLKALEIFEQERHELGRLATLPSLIKLAFLLKKDRSAEEYYYNVKLLSDKVGNTFWLAIADKQLADHYFSSGRETEALEFYRRSLAVLEEAGLKLEMAGIREKIGTIHFRGGRYTRAQAEFERSLAISREIHHKSSETDTLFSLAKLSAAEGRQNEARQLAEAALENIDSFYAKSPNSKLKRSFFSEVFDRYDFYVGLMMRIRSETGDGSSALTAMKAAERSRARSLLEHLALAGDNFTADADPAALRKEEELQQTLSSKSDRLTDLLSRSSKSEEIVKVELEIHELQHSLEQVRAELKQKSVLYSAVRNPAEFDLKEFQENILDDHSLLVKFWLSENESYVWLVGKNSFEALTLPPRIEIEGRLISLRTLLGERHQRPHETIQEYQVRILEADERYRIEARELSRILLGPVCERIVGKRLIVVADGALHSFPLSALPRPGSASDEPLLVSNEVNYLPSAQSLALLKKIGGGPRPGGGRDLLVFSDPVFAKTDERLTGVEIAERDSAIVENFRYVESLETLKRLRGAETEAASIAEIIGGSATDSFSGFDATKERLMNSEISAYKIVHFATHGFADVQRPELSGIVLSRFGAGGNQIDEFVRLQDVYGLKLNADLVVLSACETGVGKELKGEGVLSLNNAFLQSGARAVLSSLWKVEDEAAHIVMTEFYKGIADGNLTPSKALQHAQIKLMRDPRYSSPFYWAAFTLHGDGSVRPEIAGTTYFWAYFSIGLCVLFSVTVFLYRRKKYSTTAFKRTG